MKLLLENGANVNVQNIDGKTALHFARKEEHLGVVKYLIKNQAKGAWDILKEKGIGGILKEILIIIVKVIFIIILFMTVVWFMATLYKVSL